MIGDYSFGYDPEVPAGFQDADIEMRELEDRSEFERESREEQRAFDGEDAEAWQNAAERQGD